MENLSQRLVKKQNINLFLTLTVVIRKLPLLLTGSLRITTVSLGNTTSVIFFGIRVWKNSFELKFDFGKTFESALLPVTSR